MTLFDDFLHTAHTVIVRLARVTRVLADVVDAVRRASSTLSRPRDTKIAAAGTLTARDGQAQEADPGPLIRVRSVRSTRTPTHADRDAGPYEPDERSSPYRTRQAPPSRAGFVLCPRTNSTRCQPCSEKTRRRRTRGNPAERCSSPV